MSAHGSRLEAAAEISRDDIEGLARLVNESERESFFKHHPQWVSAMPIEQLCRQVARLVSIDLDLADGLVQTTRWLALRLGEPAILARSLRAAANVRHSAGDSDRAQELYEQALQGFQAVGDERESAITRSSALLNMAYLGDYDQVYDWYRGAKEVFERLRDGLRLAILEHNIGNIYYRQDRWEEARECYQLGYEEFLRLERPQDVAVCLRNIAVCEISLHHFEEALAVYEKTRTYCEEHGLDRVALQVDYNIAYLYYMRGEYARAIQLFRVARRRCESEGEDYHVALCDLDQAEIYLELNLVEEAANLAQSAYKAFERLKLPYEGAKALTNQAIALSRQGRGDLALTLLPAARETFVKEKNQLWPALIDFYRAVVLSRIGNWTEALRLADEAHRIFSASSMTSRAAMCDLLKAELFLELDRPGAARQACQEALSRMRELELPALDFQAYLVLGRVEEAVGDPAAALDAYQHSHRRLEALRSQVQGEDLKIAFLKDKQEVYESLVWLTMRYGTKEERNIRAFDYIEQAKSRSLADLLAFRAHVLAPRQPDQADLVARIRKLREELNWCYREMDRRQLENGERSQSEVRRMRETAQRTENELLRALRELRVADWELSTLQSGGVVDLSTIRSSLSEDAILIEYFVARGAIWACLVDRQRLEIRRMTSIERAREMHRLLRFQLAKLGRGSQIHANCLNLIEQATQSHLRDLYQALIEPIQNLLDCRHLIFVPHDLLHFVPFHALFDGERYLIDRYSISYAPSAGVFHLCASNTTRCANPSLVMGVADDRAPRILEEVKAVAGILPEARLLIGEDASAEALRLYGAESCFIHLATHGLFRRDNPMFSAIQLGTSRLSLFDLYDLKLNAELVVLSGCGTGLNAILGADELVGLTRGWLYAGAQSVLVTLWDVNDESTAIFMSRFYANLVQGQSKAEALRQTMRTFREQYPHPYYWAPFVLIGKPGL